MIEVVDISDLNNLPEEVAANELAIGAMLAAGIDPDYEAYWAARESCEGAASEITDGVCPECGAEDLPW